MTELCETVPGCTYLKSRDYDISRRVETYSWAGRDACAPLRWRVSREHAADLELRAQWENRMGHRLRATALLAASRAEYARSAMCAGVMG